jgi:hypothetical protein
MRRAGETFSRVEGMHKRRGLQGSTYPEDLILKILPVSFLLQRMARHLAFDPHR